MKNAIFAIAMLCSMSGPVMAQELTDMEKLNELVLIRENIEMTDKLATRGALSIEQKDKIVEKELAAAGNLLNKTLTYEELKELTGAATPPPTSWEKFSGFFSFVNVILVLAALMLTIAVVWLFGIYFLALILAVPPKLWEVVSYAVCAGLIFMGSKTNPDTQMLWILPGCFGMVGALSLNRFNWWGGKDRYDGHWDAFSSAKYFPQFASLVLMVVWGVAAIQFNSQLIGFMSVGACMTLLGFACGMFPGVVYIGFTEDAVIPRATFAAFCMGSIYTLLQITGQSSTFKTVFEVGLSWWGFFVFYLGLLIMSSKWYSYESGGFRNLKINFSKYALLNVLTILAGVAALYLGNVYHIGLLLGIGGTFFGLYLMEKWFEIPWKGAGWAWSMLGLSVFLYYFVSFAKQNPDYFLFVAK